VTLLLVLLDTLTLNTCEPLARFDSESGEWQAVNAEPSRLHAVADTGPVVVHAKVAEEELEVAAGAEVIWTLTLALAAAARATVAW
jgi:hypothetical protein